jgi:hypothetical protein
MAYSVVWSIPRPSRAGAHATTRSTPATFGTTIVMNADATIG